MELKILSIGDKGNLANERIGFKALKNCQLKYFMVFKTIKNTNGFNNTSDSVFWFAPQEILENDQVVLYTKSGINSVKENPNGTKTYFFFWNRLFPVFNGPEDIKNKIVLVNINTWSLNQ